MSDCAVEPFIQRLGSASDSVSVGTYRFGYRLKETADVLSAVDIPAEAVELVITTDLFLSASISPTGDVVSAFNSSNGISIAEGTRGTIESIENLVARALDTDNLRLEEAGPTELKILLARLERSVTLVKATLAQMSMT